MPDATVDEIVQTGCRYGWLLTAKYVNDVRSSDRYFKRRPRKLGTMRRGFAAMNPELVKRISSLGGRANHRHGSAHEFSRTEAKKYGARGGSR